MTGSPTGPPTAEELDEWERLAAKTTPGVWKLWGMQVLADQDGTGNVDTAVPVADTFCRDAEGKPRTWDATLICAAHEALPRLLAEVRRLRGDTE